MQTPPPVSVIIPVYNRPEILRNTIKSVIYQTYTNLEIWVVDDGSETDIYPVIEELNDKRLLYHRLKHENANVARNYGIVNSRGRYIAMLDSDDLWLDSHIEKCLEFMQREKVDGLYGSLIIGDPAKDNRIITARDLHENESMIDYLLSMSCGAQTSSLFMTSGSARDIMWDPELKSHQDYDFVVRYGRKYKLSAKKEATTVYTTGKRVAGKLDFASCIKFINENRDDVSPHIYNRYNYDMLRYSILEKAPEEIVSYYRTEAVYYKEYVSYAQYLAIRYPKTWIEKLICKLKYLFYILRIRVDD